MTKIISPLSTNSLHCSSNLKTILVDQHGYSSQLEQNIAFWSGETEAMVIDRYIFDYYRKMLSNNLDTSQKVDFHNLIPDEIPQYVAFKDKKLRDQFNKALAKLRDDGIYQKVVDRYIK